MEPTKGMNHKRPFIVGIAGGTGSGKTTLALHIARALGEAGVAVIDADAYYNDLSHLPLQHRHQINFDHPDALDAGLLVKHIQSLRQGRAVRKSLYDFTTHTRCADTVAIEPKPVVVVEGMLIFALPALIELFDLKIFVDEDADIRLLRRIRRDLRERGRTIEMIAEQYCGFVKPMHQQYVEPSKAHADIILRQGGESEIITRLKTIALQMQQ